MARGQATLALRSLGSVHGAYGKQLLAVRGRARRRSTGCILLFEAHASRLLISFRGKGLFERRTEVQVHVKGVGEELEAAGCAGLQKGGSVENVKDLRADWSQGGPSKRRALSGQARPPRLSIRSPGRRLHRGGAIIQMMTPQKSGIGVCAGLAQMRALQDCCCGCEDGAMAVCVQISLATKHVSDKLHALVDGFLSASIQLHLKVSVWCAVCSHPCCRYTNVCVL